MQLNHKFLIRPVTFEGLYRIEHNEYPIPAIREMLLNALIHRTYMGVFTQIRVYDDKISIWNDGELPQGVTLEKLKQHHSSRPRNLIIADVCFKGGLIDAWGSGTVRIIETCKVAGLPEPELEERDGGFAVTLFKNNLTEEQLGKLGLNVRQLKAVSHMKEKGKITNAEYQEINNVSKRTATNDLAELVTKYKLAKNTGFGAGSFYELAIGQ
jgi:ATP-dependent DNA helicase RecG